MATVLDFAVIARDRASKTFEKVGKGVDGTRTKMDKARIAAGLMGAAVAAAAVTIGRDAVRNASQAEQSLGATETVFGNFSKGVVATSQKAAKSFGLSANEYRENANLIGSLLKNQGVSNDQLAGKTQSLIQKGSDLAAVFGGTTKDAVDALASAFKGEFDPIERYGISLKQSTINAEAMNQAHVKTTAEFNKLTPAAQAAAKQQATLAIVNKQSASSQGQFAAQTSTTAERVQIARAQYTNLTATIGAQLLPVMNVLLGVGSSLLTFFSKYGKVIVPIVAVLGVLAGAIWAINAAAKAYTAVQAALNIVMSANPIGLVVIAIALLVAGLIIAYKKSETFRNIVNGAFRAVAATVGAVVGFIRAHWKLLFGILTGPVGLAVVWIATHWDRVKAIFGGIRKAIAAAFKGLAGAIEAPFRTAFGWISSAITAMVNAFKAAKNFITGGSNAAAAKVAKTHAYSVGRGGGISGVRASGGPVRMGGAYLVGENGPELFVPGQSGGIIPNGRGSKTTTDGGSDFTASAPLVLNVEGREIYRGLLTYMRKSGKTSLALG